MNAVEVNFVKPQLELPLFFTEEPTTAQIIPLEKPLEWTDANIEQLRKRLLWHSLRLLADGRASTTTMRETMEWLMSDELHPFSFVVCCHEAGYNPIGIREGVKSILDPKPLRAG